MHMLTIEGRIERKRERLAKLRRGGKASAANDALADRRRSSKAADGDVPAWAAPPNLLPAPPQPLPGQFRRSASVPLEDSGPEVRSAQLRRRSLSSFGRLDGVADTFDANAAAGRVAFGRGGRQPSSASRLFPPAASGGGGSGSSSREGSRSNSFGSFAGRLEDPWAEDPCAAVQQALPAGEVPSLERFLAVASAAKLRASHAALAALAARWQPQGSAAPLSAAAATPAAAANTATAAAAEAPSATLPRRTSP
jgi:hypothetical protein